MTEIAGLFRIDGPFFLIAGPCVLEDDRLNFAVGEALARLGDDLGLPILFKASFDKANRSRADAPRGPGLDEGLTRLERVGRATGLPLLTDVHEPAQAAAAADICAALQVPAFLCRQSDLIEAVARTGRPVNLKKGQWMTPEAMAHGVDKARRAGADAITLTERGTFFGYGDLVVDMRTFGRMREAARTPVVFDGTHSVQRPSRADGASGGDPRYTPPLVRAAIAAGADALFLEVHPEPERAPSDGRSMLRLDRLRPLLEEVLAIRSALGPARGPDATVRPATPTAAPGPAAPAVPESAETRHA